MVKLNFIWTKRRGAWPWFSLVLGSWTRVRRNVMFCVNLSHASVSCHYSTQRRVHLSELSWVVAKGQAFKSLLQSVTARGSPKKDPMTLGKMVLFNWDNPQRRLKTEDCLSASIPTPGEISPLFLRGIWVAPHNTDHTQQSKTHWPQNILLVLFSIILLYRFYIKPERKGILHLLNLGLCRLGYSSVVMLA